MIANYNLIPESTLETLVAWITTGRPLSGGSPSFCELVVTNDLKGAFSKADDDNLNAMFHTMAWLHNRAPIGSWGSPDAITTWKRTLARMRDNGQFLVLSPDGRFRVDTLPEMPTEAPCKP